MASLKCDAAQVIRETAPYLVHSICLSYCLNLTISKCSNVLAIKNALDSIFKIGTFFNVSAKRNTFMTNHLKGSSHFHLIRDALKEISSWSNSSSFNEARQLQNNMQTSDFIVVISILQHTMTLTLSLSKFL